MLHQIYFVILTLVAKQIRLKMERHVFLRNITIKRIIAKWLSYSILNIITQETKKCYRDLEKIQAKLTKKLMDIDFNKKCKENNLLPNYTHEYQNS